MVVVPSRCHENQPMSILEAYGLGTPVVATRLGGIPELVVDDVTGVIVDPPAAQHSPAYRGEKGRPALGL